MPRAFSAGLPSGRSALSVVVVVVVGYSPCSEQVRLLCALCGVVVVVVVAVVVALCQDDHHRRHFRPRSGTGPLRGRVPTPPVRRPWLPSALLGSSRLHDGKLLLCTMHSRLGPT